MVNTVPESFTTKKPVLAVLGPTASGKTSLALKLAEKFDCEIVNCDSRQIYREMLIGTACPTAAEMQRAAHHLFCFISPSEAFSAADYALAAAETIRNIWSRGKIPLLTGGTGFYYAAISEGLGNAGHDQQRTEQLQQLLQNKGLAHLVAMLEKIDPTAVTVVDLNNPRRVIRAIEVVELTKKPFAANQPQMLLPEATFFPVVVTRPREELHLAISSRVEKMIEAGLEQEVKTLLQQFGADAPGLNSIGYHEWFGFFNGEATLKQVKELIVIHTRQYAKRQETWFRRRPGVAAFNLSDRQQVEAIFPQTAAFLSNFAL